MLHGGSVATIERHGHFCNHIRVLEGIREFSQQHAHHGRHVSGTDDSRTGHVKGSHNVVGQKQIVVRTELKRRELGIPSQPQNIDARVVDHVSRAKLQQHIGQIGPPFRAFFRALVLDLCRGVVFLGQKGGDQARAQDRRVAHGRATRGGFLGGRRVFGPAKLAHQDVFARESNDRQEGGAQQRKRNIEAGKREVYGGKSVVQFQIEICHRWNRSCLAHGGCFVLVQCSCCCSP